MRVDGAAVFHGHAFGLAGGAGGVDDVGDVAGRNGYIRSALRISGEVILVEEQEIAGEGRGQSFDGDDLL